jgi:thioredoxin-like negative regulator of GroEL
MSRLRALQLSLLLLAAPHPAAAASSNEVLPFIADDYGKALAEARARHLPLFIDVWTPWCHSCRSMKAFVFTDRSLQPQAGRFVWLSLDGEKPGNASLSDKLVIEGFPTLFVVDPADERVVLRRLGAATVGQLHQLLEEGRRAVTGGHPGGPLPAAADEAFARADRLYATRDNAGAAKAFEEAIAKAPEGWPSYGRAVESLLAALDSGGECARAARLAQGFYPKLRRSAAAANVVVSGLECALRLPETDGQRAELVRTLEGYGRESVADPAVPMSADDRSSLFGSLMGARQAARDEAGALKTARDWAAFLEAEAARAPTPEARAVFDSHRLSVYLELGQPERALPMLEASERDLPGDYNPPARLAVALNALKRWDEALAAGDRALARAYGPRRLRILQVRADSCAGRGDKPAARAALEQALREAEALPTPQRSAGAIASLQKKVDALR